MSGRNCARFCRSWAICWASSRVGLKMTACGLRLAGSTLDRMGMPNATVLPVPVGALAIISCPASISGMAFSWISVMSVKPIACVARMISGETFVSSVNCMVVLPFGFIRHLVEVGHVRPLQHSFLFLL